MISLESVQFARHYIAVDGQCKVYSFGNKLQQNQNKNDINLFLYVRPQINVNSEAKQIESASNQILKPGIVVIQHAFNKCLRVKPGNEGQANGIYIYSNYTFYIKHK